MYQVDRFVLENVDVENDISSITISTDGTGRNCEWHVSYVVVERSRDGKTYKFDINQWVDKTTDFQVTVLNSEKQDILVNYEVTFMTSNRK